MPTPIANMAQYRQRSPREKRYTNAAIPNIGRPYLPILRTKIQPVIVVPMLAPMITPMACDNCIAPLFTNPMTITVVIELDCTTQVTTTPTVVAKKRLLVTAPIILRRLEPATACMPSDICFMPSRKMPNPPTMVVNICVT